MIGVTTNAGVVAADLGKVAGVVVRQARVVVESSAIDVRDEWRRNANQTAGIHGKWYPSSIRYQMTGVLEATIQPQSGFKQAEMSFEFGSVNQPPHLDGQRAIDRMAPLIERRLANILGYLG